MQHFVLGYKCYLAAIGLVGNLAKQNGCLPLRCIFLVMNLF